MILEDRDLHDQAFDQRFIKFCDDGGLLPDEILQVLDQAHDGESGYQHLCEAASGEDD